MLDDDERVSCVGEPVQDGDELVDVFEVQACGWLVEDVEGVLARWGAVVSCAFAEFCRELDALGFAAREGGGWLSECDVSEPDIAEACGESEDLGVVLEESARVFDGHREDISDVLSSVEDLKGFSVVAFGMADLALDEDIGEEVHLDLFHALSCAGFATPSAFVGCDIEGEASGLIATDFGFFGRGKDFADVVEDSCVGRGVGPWGSADRGLIDFDDPVDVLEPVDACVGAGLRFRAHDVLFGGSQEDLVDEGRFARPGNSSDSEHASDGEGDIDVLEVVVLGTLDDHRLFHVELASGLGDLDLLSP